MALLARHLEQISLSAESIATLPFPAPKMFTNALLTTHDITALIRDTEPHERALFSVPISAHASATSTHPSTMEPATSRRQTVFAVSSGEVITGTGPATRAPRRNTAVAAVLGSELHSQVRRTEDTQLSRQGEVDVQVLLRGAEKLNAAYAMPGVPERIARLAARYAQAKDGVVRYEKKVDSQTRELERLNRGEHVEDDDEETSDDHGSNIPASGQEQDAFVTEEDLRLEEEEIRELEKRKKELEERVSGMERDLGGLLR